MQCDPVGLSLDQLHLTIQKIMGRDNSHMHAFYVSGVEYAGDETARECDVHCDEKFYLHQLVKRSGQRFIYEYDFGDRWMHDIVVEKTNPCPGEPPPARCLAGTRACPPTMSAVPTATSPSFTTAPTQSQIASNSGQNQPGCSPSNPNASTSTKLIAA